MQLLRLLIVPGLIGLGTLIAVHRPSLYSSTGRDDNGARAAFIEAYKVFMYPRCMNCHPAGDSPLQGDDSRTHFYRVRRGTDGNGVYSMKCTNCHQATNQPGLNMPPGASNLSKDDSANLTPRWRLPPTKTPMVFQGRTPSQLCSQLKDQTENGGMTAEALIRHISSDPLVLWGWDPGEGRSKPPLSHDKFVENIKAWLGKGGACPK